MPIYEYLCKKCKKKFTVTMSLAQYEKTKVKCPKCQSTQVEQEVHSFFAVTSKKS